MFSGAENQKSPPDPLNTKPLIPAYCFYWVRSRLTVFYGESYPGCIATCRLTVFEDDEDERERRVRQSVERLRRSKRRAVWLFLWKGWLSLWSCWISLSWMKYWVGWISFLLVRDLFLGRWLILLRLLELGFRSGFANFFFFLPSLLHCPFFSGWGKHPLRFRSFRRSGCSWVLVYEMLLS